MEGTASRSLQCQYAARSHSARWWMVMTVCAALLIISFGVSSASATAEDSRYSESESNPRYSAVVNISYVDPKTKEVKTESRDMGTYSARANTETVSGVLVHVVNPDNSTEKAGCKEYWFKVPIVPWIALVKRGTCTFDQKIRMATKKNNASGVIIYNDNEKVFKNLDNKVKDVPAIFISADEGEHLLELMKLAPLEGGEKGGVTVTLSRGVELMAGPGSAALSRTSVLFVSISFIVLMIISLAWLVFYYIQRFRYAHAKERLARRLARAAKKAIGKIPQRTVKTGDRELESDFDPCAVCIEGYKAHDVIRSLPCKHVFHKSCVDPWLLDQRSCPMCKLDILRAYGMQVGGSQESVHPDGESEPTVLPVDAAEQTSTADEQGEEGQEVKVLLIPHSYVYFHPRRLSSEEGECSSTQHSSLEAQASGGGSPRSSVDESDCTELHSLIENPRDLEEAAGALPYPEPSNPPATSQSEA